MTDQASDYTAQRAFTPEEVQAMTAQQANNQQQQRGLDVVPVAKQGFACLIRGSR